ENAIARLWRKRDTTIPETRTAALVPRKHRTLDIIRKDSGKKMKKVQNKRSKDGEIMALASTTGLTSSNWMEIMEHEIVYEVDDNLMKNFTVFNVEGSGNLCDKRSELKNKQVIKEKALKDAQTIVIERVENLYIDSSQELAAQETVVVDQDEAVLSSNVEPSNTLTKGLNEGNIALVTPVVNREESNQKNNNRSYNQHTLINNGTKDTIQPIEDDGFIEVIHIPGLGIFAVKISDQEKTIASEFGQGSYNNSKGCRLPQKVIHY
ncbi:9585_t:CDS:2, partial [Gigaspora margarita]